MLGRDTRLDDMVVVVVAAKVLVVKVMVVKVKVVVGKIEAVVTNKTPLRSYTSLSSNRMVENVTVNTPPVTSGTKPCEHQGHGVQLPGIHNIAFPKLGRCAWRYEPSDQANPEQ